MFFFCVIPFMIATSVVVSDITDDDSKGKNTESSWIDDFSVTSTGGVAVTDNPTCSQIAADVLSEGGNAVDAAVAAALCLGVVSPASSGLGGGCFILSYNASTGESYFIDSRETAPALATENMFVDDPLKAQWGGLAVAIPAELRGLYHAWDKSGGGVSWHRVVEPAAALANRWQISEAEATYIAAFFRSKDTYYDLYPDIFDMYSDRKGNPKKEGDYVQNPALSQTLYNIADQGPDYLYSTMAATLAQEIQDAGGIVSTNDITSYTPVERDVMKAEVWGHTFLGAPPPSSGGLTIIAILQYIAGYTEPVASLGDLYYHRLLEGMKHAFAIRMSLGDPDFVNITDPVNDVLYNGIMDSLRQNSSDSGVLPNVSDYGGEKYGPVFQPEDHGTSHLTIIDKDGNAVALTSTINTYFGSGVMSASTGIVFNNEMDDFSIPNASNAFGLAPFTTNYVEPGKRPLSSMSPTIVTRTNSEKVRVVGGASGGPRIITATVQVL
ncbi:GGT1 [Symbiodinium microadriaticum]|nr:GGT1 [Symbiodinium microadriaticum]